MLFVVISCYLLFSRLFIFDEITANNNAKQQNNNVEQQIPTDNTHKSSNQESKINIQVVNHSFTFDYNVNNIKMDATLVIAGE